MKSRPSQQRRVISVKHDCNAEEHVESRGPSASTVLATMPPRTAQPTSVQFKSNFVAPPHPSKRTKAAVTTSHGASLAASAAVSLSCPVCFEFFFLPVQTSCEHTFCFLCLFHATVRTCPVCREPVSFAATHEGRGSSEGVKWDDFMTLQVHVLADTTARVTSVRRLTRRLVSVAPPDMLPRDAVRTLLNKSVSRSAHAAAVDAVEAACREWAESLLGLLRSCSVLSHDDDKSELRMRAQYLAVTAAATGSSGSVSVAEDASRPIAGESQSAQAEHAEVYFAHGYMRRRAPSIVIVRGGESDGDDDDDLNAPYNGGEPGAAGVPRRGSGGRPHSIGARGRPPAVGVGDQARSSIVVDTTEFPSLVARADGDDSCRDNEGGYKRALRARVAEVLARATKSTTATNGGVSAKLPILTDLDKEYENADGTVEGGVVRFVPQYQHPLPVQRIPHPRCDQRESAARVFLTDRWGYGNDFVADDDTCAEIQDEVVEKLLCANALPLGSRSAHASSAKPSSSSSSSLIRLPSADTRYQSEMRLLQKRASADAAARCCNNRVTGSVALVLLKHTTHVQRAK